MQAAGEAAAVRRARNAGTGLVAISTLSVLVLAVAFAFSAFLLLSGLVDDLPQPHYMSKRTQVIVRMALNLVFTSVSVFILWAGLRMRRLQGLKTARLAATLACVPCVSPCLLLGIPVGVWALSALRAPEVEAAFRD